MGGGVSMENTSWRAVRAVEAVGALGVPHRGPVVLDAVEAWASPGRWPVVRRAGRLRLLGPRWSSPSVERRPRLSAKPGSEASGHVGSARPGPQLACPLQLFDTAQGEGPSRSTQREPGKVSHVRVRAHRLRPSAPRPRPVLARVRRAAPLPRVVGLRGAPTSRTSPTSTTRSSSAPTTRAVTGRRDRRASARTVWCEAMDGIGVERPTDDPHATAYVDADGRR